jgi:hypothetical protein
MIVLNKYNIKQPAFNYYYVDLNYYCKYQAAQELKKIMASSMHDDSLESLESKIKIIDIIFVYLDKIDKEFNNYVRFNEGIILEQKSLD